MEEKNGLKWVWVAIGIILIAGIGYWYFSGENPSWPGSAQREAEVATYTNPTYGYSFDYPSSLELKEYSPENVAFGDVAEARILTVKGDSGEPFSQSTAREIAKLCAADGPDESFACTGAEGIGTFKTAAGATGYEFYLIGQLRNGDTEETAEYRKGPYFAFLLKTGATGSSALVIHPPLNQNAEETDAEAIRAMAGSLKFKEDTVDTAKLESYISARISDLAPIKEQLGGKFFVTDIEAWGGSGTVEYEDGHSAYTADFTYETGTDGEISITSFKLRK